jgi:hypothetical protein
VGRFYNPIRFEFKTVNQQESWERGVIAGRMLRSCNEDICYTVLGVDLLRIQSEGS